MKVIVIFCYNSRVLELNKKSSNTNISIGPFVDKSVASTLALRIKELTKRDGKIKRLNN